MLSQSFVKAFFESFNQRDLDKNKRDVPYENEGVTIMELKDRKVNFISDFSKDTEIF